MSYNYEKMKCPALKWYERFLTIKCEIWLKLTANNKNGLTHTFYLDGENIRKLFDKERGKIFIYTGKDQQEVYIGCPFNLFDYVKFKIKEELKDYERGIGDFYTVMLYNGESKFEKFKKNYCTIN